VRAVAFVLLNRHEVRATGVLCLAIVGAMSDTRKHPTPDEAEEYFRGLLDEAGLDQPDAVEYDIEADELIFLWQETKTAVVVELSGDGTPPALGGMPPPPV
jgi:hypothetical protein